MTLQRDLRVAFTHRCGISSLDAKKVPEQVDRHPLVDNTLRVESSNMRTLENTADPRTGSPQRAGSRTQGHRRSLRRRGFDPQWGSVHLPMRSIEVPSVSDDLQRPSQPLTRERGINAVDG